LKITISCYRLEYRLDEQGLMPGKGNNFSPCHCI